MIAIVATGGNLRLMRAVRFFIAMLIVLGLAMPTLRSTALAAPAHAMEDCDSMPASGGDDCPCCEKAAKCPANFCAIKCLKSVEPAEFSTTVFASASSILSWSRVGVLKGIDRPPPAPPPRT